MGEQDLHPGDGGDEVVHELGHRVGVGGVPEPDAVLEHPEPGSRYEAHLGAELAALFGAVVELLRELPVEEHHGLADVDAVLGSAEAQDIDARLPGDLAGSDAERRHGVGEPRAVHVELELVLLRHRADRAELRRGVERADLRRLRDGDHGGLGIMDVRAPFHRLLDARGRQPAVLARELEQLGAVAEELRRAALIGLDVGHAVAEDAVVALCGMGERERVRRGAVEDEEHLARRLEDLADRVRRPAGPLVVAVGGDMMGVGFGEGGPSFGRDAGVVVGGEMSVGHGILSFSGSRGSSSMSYQRTGRALVGPGARRFRRPSPRVEAHGAPILGEAGRTSSGPDHPQERPGWQGALHSPSPASLR